MRLLVLGGTWFLGRSIVAESLRRGWPVTTFRRGRTSVDVPGVQAVRATGRRQPTCKAWDARLRTP